MGSRYFLFYDINSELCQFNDHPLLHEPNKSLIFVFFALVFPLQKHPSYHKSCT